MNVTLTRRRQFYYYTFTTLSSALRGQSNQFINWLVFSTT